VVRSLTDGHCKCCCTNFYRLWGNCSCSPTLPWTLFPSMQQLLPSTTFALHHSAVSAMSYWTRNYILKFNSVKYWEMHKISSTWPNQTIPKQLKHQTCQQLMTIKWKAEKEWTSVQNTHHSNAWVITCNMPSFSFSKCCRDTSKGKQISSDTSTTHSFHTKASASGFTYRRGSIDVVVSMMWNSLSRFQFHILYRSVNS